MTTDMTNKDGILVYVPYFKIALPRVPYGVPYARQYQIFYHKFLSWGSSQGNPRISNTSFSVQQQKLGDLTPWKKITIKSVRVWYINLLYKWCITKCSITRFLVEVWDAKNKPVSSSLYPLDSANNLNLYQKNIISKIEKIYKKI